MVHFPKNEDIFNVFEMPLQNIKVVILGQDPYPTEGNAIGYAFAVNEDINKPSVLIVNGKNIPVLQPGFNYVLTAPHPAAEAYSGGTAGFLGCNHFNQVNEILKNTKKELIKF